MNTLLLVQETIRDLEEDQKKLSLIVQKCIRIASNMNDYYHLALLKKQTVSFMNKGELTSSKFEFYFKLQEKGYEDEQIKKIHRGIVEKHINIRMVNYENEEKMSGLSVSEIENQIQLIKQSIDKNIIPEGLHQLDLYFENKSKQELDMLLLNSLKMNQDVLDSIKSFLYSYLIEAETKLSQNQGDTDNEDVQIMNKNVFIIHGHNEAKWRELEKIIKDDFGLNPIILGEKSDGGMSTIIDKFEFYADQCSYAFALFTPDDIVESDGKRYFQARPNVIFELGWFVARLGSRNVCLILQETQDTIQMFSDLQGVIQKRFQKNVREIYRDVMLELRDVGMIE